MELGYSSIMRGLEEIMECSAEIRWAFTDLEAEPADVLCFYGAGADLWRDDTGDYVLTSMSQAQRQGQKGDKNGNVQECGMQEN